MRLVTITLGFRKWETTNVDAANQFMKSFGGGFTKIEEPYEGIEIPNIKPIFWL